MKKTVAMACFLFILLIFSGVAFSSSISVTGVVKQPLTLSMDNVKGFESVDVRLNEVRTDKSYHGAFVYRGIPLRTVLELASVQKEESSFSKAIDLAVVIHNKNGDQTVLSWGEIFYRNKAEIIIAYSSTPIMPHRGCQNCHAPEVYQMWLSPLQRQVDLPRLVVADDFYSDRSLEGITTIEVVDLHPKITVQKIPELFSSKITISGSGQQGLEMTDVSSYPHLEILAKQIGDGRGYHGLKHFRGVSLLELLRESGVETDLNTVFLVSAPDGYRSLISYGELFLNPEGKNIIIADSVDNQPITKAGKFNLVIPNDLSADRMVKAAEKIEVISLKQKAKLYIIGIGCADTSLISLEAISCMGKSDVFVSTDNSCIQSWIFRQRTPGQNNAQGCYKYY